MNGETEQKKAVDRLKDLFEIIYKQEKDRYHKTIMGCPWNGLEALTAQRIDSDLSGINAYFSIRSPGQQGKKDENENHIPCLGTGNGIINKYKNSRFIEYLVTVDTNNYITDEEDGDRLYAPRRT